MTTLFNKTDPARASKLRRGAAAILLVILAIYMWLALKEEGSFRSFVFIPNAVAVFVDNHFYARNLFAFGLLGVLAAAAVWGLRLRIVTAVLVACMAIPFAKDGVQMLTATRHFDWVATLSGVLGVLAGWVVGFWLVSKVVSVANGKEKHVHQH